MYTHTRAHTYTSVTFALPPAPTTTPAKSATETRRRHHGDAAGVSFFVDPLKGKDNQPFAPTSGGIDSPFKTIASAVAATRAVRATSGGKKYLQEGGGRRSLPL